MGVNKCEGIEYQGFGVGDGTYAQDACSVVRKACKGVSVGVECVEAAGMGAGVEDGGGSRLSRRGRQVGATRHKSPLRLVFEGVCAK